MTSEESVSGEHHHDERDALAYVYDGSELIATLYRPDLVRECQGRWMDVSLTPEGEEVLGS